MDRTTPVLCLIMMLGASLLTMMPASADLEDAGNVENLEGRAVSWQMLGETQAVVLFAEGVFQHHSFDGGKHTLLFELTDLPSCNVAKVDPTGTLAALATDDGVLVVNLASRTIVDNISTDFPATSLGWDIDGDLWVGETGGSRNAAEYRAGAATGIATQAHSIGITDIQVLSSGAVATSGNDEKIMVDDLSGGAVEVLTDHDDRVLVLGIDADGNLLSGAADGVFMRHSTSDWSSDTFEMGSSTTIQYIRQQGEDIMVGGLSGTVNILNATTLEEEEEFSIGGQIKGVHRGERGEVYLIAALSGTTSIRLYDIDSDNDGHVDSKDAFPDDPSEHEDSDRDGVGDNGDAFPNNPSESSDTDGDGVGDNADEYPEDSSESVDSDGDGVGDNGDAFPNDSSQWADEDSDGLGDNIDGNNPDHCPGVNGGSEHDRRGCPDSDGDGWSDPDGDWLSSPNGSADAFPNDRTQWADSDGDGYGDDPQGTKGDACPTTAGDSRYSILPEFNESGIIVEMQKIDQFGCLDSDGDGYADHGDDFPENPDEYKDQDRDEIGAGSDYDDTDPSVATKEDACLNNPTDTSAFCMGLKDEEYKAYVAQAEADGESVMAYYAWVNSKNTEDIQSKDKEENMDSRIKEAATYGGIAFVGIVALLLIINGMMNMGRKRSFNKSFGEGFSANASLAELAAHESGEEFETAGGVIDQGDWGDEVSDMSFSSSPVKSDYEETTVVSSEDLYGGSSSSMEDIAGIPASAVAPTASDSSATTAAPATPPPIPAEGLPPGWTEDQWRWYGHEWLAKNK